MSAVKIGTFTPGSPEWHAARINGLGGSEIAPVLGLSPFESRFSLYHRKAGTVAPVAETPEMEWGKRLEAPVLDKFRDEHPEWSFDDENATWHHQDRPWQIANPDMIGDACVEAKCSRFGDGWGEPGTDEIPIYYRTQCLWYLDTFQRWDRIHIAVLVGGSDYREYHVDYDEAEATQLRDAAREFLGTLERGEQPDINGHSATYEVIREMHPDIDGTDVELDHALALRYLTTRAEAEAAKTREQHAKSLVADAMGNAKKALWDGDTIATRQARKTKDGSPGTPYVVAGRNLPEITPITHNQEAVMA